MTYLIYNFKERNCWSQIFETEKRMTNKKNKLKNIKRNIMDMLNQKNKNIELKFGEKYLLNSNNYYFCIPLQRGVKFTGNVAVEFTSRSELEGICFGKLIDIGGQDYVTDNEIEFYEDDVIEQYEMNVIPLLYMDFLL